MKGLGVKNAIRITVMNPVFPRQGEGACTCGTHPTGMLSALAKFLPKNCMKIEEIGPGEGACPWRLLDPPMYQMLLTPT